VRGVRHGDLRISAKQAKIGPKASADEPDTTDVDGLVLKKVNVGKTTSEIAGVPDTFLDERRIKLVVSRYENHGDNMRHGVGEPLQTRDDALVQNVASANHDIGIGWRGLQKRLSEFQMEV
jgi:hypothetical protein